MTQLNLFPTSTDYDELRVPAQRHSPTGMAAAEEAQQNTKEARANLLA